MKIFQSIGNEEAKLVIESDDLTKIAEVHKQCRENLPKLRGEYCVVGSDDQRIVSGWYSDYCDEPLQSRHYVSHPEYYKIW